MLKAERRSQQLTTLDDLSRRQTPLHRLDPRAKLLTTLLFVALVVSLDRYELSRLAPYSIYPIFLAAAGGVPPGWLARRIAWIAPFAVALGIANPLLDRAPMLALGPLTLSGGWVSFCSLLGRSVLTV
ncbi:MAG: cobalt ECF transporter T component CbiQ, partial [Deltaproteobacteria bacterium]|nr:cobalt ECF transporter T component CbiQ [Deltaproteobacteria bacterium]